MSADHERGDQLNDYLDALAEGAAPRRLDPDTIDAVRRFFAADDASAAPEAVTDQIWEDLMNQMNQPSPSGAAPLTSSLISPPSLNGHRIVHAPWPPASAPSIGQKPRHGAAARLALAALLLLTLIGAWRFASHGEPGAGSNLPAAAGSPIAAPIVTPDPATALGALIDTMLPGGLAGPAQYVDIERWVYFANDSVTRTIPLQSNIALLVLSGQVAIKTGTPTQLVRSLGALSAEPVAADVQQALSAGQALVIGPSLRPLTIDHQGLASAVVLWVNILDPNVGVPFQTGVSFNQLGNAPSAFSPAPLHLTLRRAALAPQETLPAPAAGTVQLVVSESTPPGKLTQSGGAVTNAEAKLLHVLILTITQAGGQATPAA